MPVSLPLLPAADPPVRVMALHALLYCERLFYLEEVEEIRVADAAVYAGRELHGSLAAKANGAAGKDDADEAGAREEMELASPALGLFGKVDCLRRRDGQLVPYEHKRGRCRRGDGTRGGDDNTPTTWPSDRIQAAAYAMMLEEAIGKPVPEARVRYHADGVTVRVPIDETHPQSPVNPYGESKLMVEKILRWYGDCYGLQWMALRYFNAAGAAPDGEIGEDHDPESHLIPLVIGAATSSGGSPGRRSDSMAGTGLPPTRATVSMTSLTEWPRPVPRLIAWLAVPARSRSIARRCASARSMTWT